MLGLIQTDALDSSVNSVFLKTVLLVAAASVLSCICTLRAEDDAAPFIAPQKMPDAAIVAIHDKSAPLVVPASAEKPAEKSAAKSAEPDNGQPQVRLIVVKTDAVKRYRAYVPALPFKPFTDWRKWFNEHVEAAHCALEWRDENGKWWHGEMHSTHFDPNSNEYRVGYGEFPCTGYDAYGVYIKPGPVPREVDHLGRKVEVTLDEEVKCDYHRIEAELKKYGSKTAKPGDPGTGGTGKENVGLGGPAYKPAQNSNTMINYVLRRCGVQHKAPDLAVGWDREPHFPYSSDADAPKLDSTP